MMPPPGLVDLLGERTCLVGVGNTIRRDDGVGPWIADAIRPALEGTSLCVFNAEDVLESYVFQIAGTDCRNVIIMDAAATDGEPGSVVFGPLGEFAEASSVSTHKPALEFSGKILEAAGKRVFLLGLVPEDLGFGFGLTPRLQELASRLRDLILRTVAHPGVENVHES
jgi:hydrogenase 3 maturation protease